MNRKRVAAGAMFGVRRENTRAGHYTAPERVTWHIARKDGQTSLCGLVEFFGPATFRDEHRERIAGEHAECGLCARIAEAQAARQARRRVERAAPALLAECEENARILQNLIEDLERLAGVPIMRGLRKRLAATRAAIAAAREEAPQ